MGAPAGVYTTTASYPPGAVDAGFDSADANERRLEELIHELKSAYTIVIVTHNMQQAARVSDLTAYFYLDRLIEFGPTERVFTNCERPKTEDYITGRFG